MALKLDLTTKQGLYSELEEKRAALKALPEESRPDSQELAEYETVEKKLRLNMHGPFGVALPESYLNVNHVTFTKDKAVVNLNVFANVAHRQSGEAPVRNFSQEFALPESVPGNPLAWGYEKVKALPEFADAVDV